MSIDVRELSFAYGRRQVLRNVTFRAEPGQLVAVLGPNGAGKSTIIRHFTGVYRPDSGQVTLDGQPVYENPAAKSRMAVIPDDWYYFPQASIRDMARLYAGTHPFFSWDRYHKLREAFPLPEKQLLRRMSKGMQKQAAFWLVMSCMPEVLVLDEPTAMLDPRGRTEVLRTIHRLNRERGMSILFISHNLAVVRKLCTRVAVMEKGHIVESGPVDQIFFHPQAPYTQRLIAAIPTRRKL